MAKLVRDMSEALSWEVLSPVSHWSSLTRLGSLRLPHVCIHTLAGRRFGSYEDVKKWPDQWFAAKAEDFSGLVFVKCPKDGENE